MKLVATDIPELLLLEPTVFQDERGYFMETFHARKLAALGLEIQFVQENQSSSVHATLRGLHYQNPHPQGKLVRVTRGEVYDVAVDLRTWAPTFGRWFATILSESNRKQLYVPEGFAHGFCVLSGSAEFVYKCTDFYHPDCEHIIRWDDPDLAIEWPLSNPVLSPKDQRGEPLREALTFRS